jgi:hypothetical protein
VPALPGQADTCAPVSPTNLPILAASKGLVGPSQEGVRVPLRNEDATWKLPPITQTLARKRIRQVRAYGNGLYTDLNAELKRGLLMIRKADKKPRAKIPTITTNLLLCRSFERRNFSIF